MPLSNFVPQPFTKKYQTIQNDDDGEEYKVEIICDSVVYAKKSESDHLLGLYYLVS